MSNGRTLRDLWTDYLERSFNVLIPILAILCAFLVSGLLILAWGSSPLGAYSALFSGAFGSPNAIATTMVRSTPLILTGLAVAYGYRGGFFNIGAEGQLYMGAFASVWVGVTLADLPGIVLIPVCMVAASAAGSLYALLPGLLKAKRGINEVLTTLLMNYIAIQFAEWVMRVNHIMPRVKVLDDGSPAVWTWLNWIGIKDPTQPFPKSPFTGENAYLPSLQSIMSSKMLTSLFGGAGWHEAILSHPAFNRMTLAYLVAVLMAVVIYFVMFKSTIGYKARAVGINPSAAKAIGVSVPRSIITTALISGALAGLAGGLEVLGSQHRIIPNFLVGAGFDGIAVALIGQLHPLGVLLSATFFGALRAGANKMQIITLVPVAVVYVIQALAILFAIAGTTFDVGSTLKKRRLTRQQREPESQTKAGEASHA